jgi:hypothetical protein
MDFSLHDHAHETSPLERGFRRILRRAIALRYTGRFPARAQRMPLKGLKC